MLLQIMAFCIIVWSTFLSMACMTATLFGAVYFLKEKLTLTQTLILVVCSFIGSLLCMCAASFANFLSGNTFFSIKKFGG